VTLTLSTAQILVLGAAAGLPIFVGLPMGRMHWLDARVKCFFSSIATGILLFLLWDVLAAAVDPVETALKDGRGGRFAWLATLLAVGFAVGLLSLVAYDGWMKRRRRKAFVSAGAAAATDYEHHFVGLSPARWLALFIATGIGLHNFSEGLAIGQSAARDEISLALVLIIGFGLHNATEGFGIVAPLATDAQVPSWGFLALLGLVGGGPTFLGTVLGQAWVNESLSVAVLALAAGSILYVVMELLNVSRTFGSKQATTLGILLGLVLGFGTDFILIAAGA
jgi:zinc transporter, ZIP family